MRALFLAVTSIAILSASVSAQFLETFDDGNASSRWTAPIIEAETGEFDGNVDFAFDYSTLGVPPAPGGGDTIGLFMEANLNDDTDGDEGEVIGMSPLTDLLPTGDYVVSMDVYFNVDNNAGGTTEFGLFGVHAAGANNPNNPAVNDDVPFDFGLSNGDGLSWHLSGEGGASNDIHRFEDADNAELGTQTGLGSYDDIPDGTIPGVPTGTNTFPKFGPEEQWIDVSIERIDDTISLKMNGQTLDTVNAATSPSEIPYDGGKILIGYGDVFNSVADPSLGLDSLPNHTHFIVFDNVKVDVPSTDLACDLVAPVGCDINDLDALYVAPIDPVSWVDTIGGWLEEASDPSNPLKGSATNIYVMGDVNLDGSVDSTDLGLLLNSFGESENSFGNGDVNNDATVDSSDLGLLLNNFAFASSAATVPEPSSAAMILISLVALSATWRRSRCR